MDLDSEMLKIVSIVDKKGTALDRLAQGVAKYHDNLDYVVCDVHPKRPDRAQLQRFEAEAMDADIIDAQYYRSLYKLREIYSWLKDKKTVLTHNNPYSIEEQEWNDVDVNVGNNNYITKRLREITKKPVEQIPLTIDTDFWTFNPDWSPAIDKVNATNNYNWQGVDTRPSVLMVANRIEGKKGILPIAKACKKIGIKFILVGSISNAQYMQEIEDEGVEFYPQVSDETLRELYYTSTLHVCNSVDGFESGTLPILESMMCGTPVMSRNIGHVPDFYNGENLFLYEGDPEDVDAIQSMLLEVLADSKRLFKVREAGWNSVKNRTHELRAYAYQKLYRTIMQPDQLSVSVIIPITGSQDVIKRCMNAVGEQTYKNTELILVDDSGEYEAFVKDYAKFFGCPVRYIDNAQGDYGLARARNMGAIESTGEVLVFCDQRMLMDKQAIEIFVQSLQPKTWLYGNKGAKKDFVENFSCINRSDFMTFGMFNERMTAYGGLSQETRDRARNQGIVTKYIESAKAEPTGKSRNKYTKKQDIIQMKARLIKMELK